MTAASMQTRHARADADQAAEVWRAHRKACSRCDLAMCRHRYDDFCEQGRVALQIRRDLAARAAKEAALDQGTLFEGNQP